MFCILPCSIGRSCSQTRPCPGSQRSRQLTRLQGCPYLAVMTIAAVLGRQANGSMAYRPDNQRTHTKPMTLRAMPHASRRSQWKEYTSLPTTLVATISDIHTRVPDSAMSRSPGIGFPVALLCCALSGTLQRKAEKFVKMERSPRSSGSATESLLAIL